MEHIFGAAVAQLRHLFFAQLRRRQQPDLRLGERNETREIIRPQRPLPGTGPFGWSKCGTVAPPGKSNIMTVPG